MRHAIRSLFCLVLLLCAAGIAHAGATSRSALVIGNSAYASAPLRNALNDAEDMAAALKASGFAVTLVRDADQKTMDEAIRAFGERLKEQKGVGLFYYSGHGVQVEGRNYLIPVGGKISDERDVKYRAVDLGRLLDEIKAAGNGLNIVVVDACRNNPLGSASRSATRGLARVESGGGLFVSYSTSPGEVALDGKGRNSPYTKHLVKAIGTPGLTLEGAFKATLKGVYTETDGKQIPWISSSFFGDFLFQAPTRVASGTSPQSPATQSQATPPQPDTQAASETAPEPQEPSAGERQQQMAQIATELSKSLTLSPGRTDIDPGKALSLPGLYRVAGTNPNGSRYRGSVAIIGEDGGRRYRFIWWIGKQVFNGEGARDGRWLRIDWGSSSPVIYTVGADGVLDGLWADGSASELVTPHAPASAAPGTPIAGNYTVRGRGANGGSYRGVVRIAKSGSGYSVKWTIGNSRYSGCGRLENGILIVDWGQASPAVYAVGDNGVLSGLWAAGRGEERLTPR